MNQCILTIIHDVTDNLAILVNSIKCKKHFIKMLKDVGMVVPKIKETRL